MHCTLNPSSFTDNIKNNLFLLISCVANICLLVSYILKMDLFLAIIAICLFLGAGVFTIRRPEQKLFQQKSISVFTLLFETLLLVQFYGTLKSSFISRFVSAMGLPSDAVILFLGGILCVAGSYCAYWLISLFMESLRPFTDLIKASFTLYCIIAIVYCVGISAIVRANYLYVDDMGRTMFGYQLTGSFSRYFATFLSTILHGNTWLTDISPLTQYLAACIMALAAVLFIHIVTGQAQHSFWTVLAIIPFGLSPYFLECYSYKFDAPYMAFSVLAAIAPLLYRKEHPVKYSIITAIGTLIVCTTYQASSGLFPMIVVFLALQMWINKQQTRAILAFILHSALGYISGMLLFRFAFLVPVNSGESYVSSFLDPANLIINIRQYTTMILQQHPPVWLILIGIISLSFILTTIITSRRNKWTTAIIAIFSVIVMFLLAFGAYILLSSPLYAPRAMYGFGIFLSLLALPLMGKENKAFVGSAAVLALSWMFFVFSFTYGNALALQKEYTDFRIDQVLTDLNDLEMLSEQDPVVIQIEGSVGHANAVSQMASTYPLLEKLVTVQFRASSWYWGDFQLLNFYHTNSLSTDDSLDLTTLNLPILTDSMYHTIRGNEGYILIELK